MDKEFLTEAQGTPPENPGQASNAEEKGVVMFFIIFLIL